MATKVMSLRLPDDLREWVIAYAGERQVSQAVVISAAVRVYRELAKTGVPELEEPSATTPAPKSVPGTPGRGQIEAAEDRPVAAAASRQRASGSAAPRAPVREGGLEQAPAVDGADRASAASEHHSVPAASARASRRKAVIAPFDPVQPQDARVASAVQERMAAIEARQRKLNAAKERNG